MKDFDLNKRLERNDRFSLAKDSGYSKIQVDLSWRTAGLQRFGLKGLDLDACAFLVGEDGIINDDADFVYYNSECRWLPSDPRWPKVVAEEESPDEIDVTDGSFCPFDKIKFKNKRNWRKWTLPVSKDGSLIGSWDDPGEDGEDDEESGETMHVLLDNVRDEISDIIFCVSIYPNPENGPIENQTFDKVTNAKIEIRDEESDKVLCYYNLNEKFVGKTAVEVGRFVRNDDGGWDFVALGDGHEGGMQTLISIYA